MPQLENQVQDKLKENEPVGQDEFVESLSADFDQANVLGALRRLMERNKVSYNIDYDLQTEEDI